MLHRSGVDNLSWRARGNCLLLALAVTCGSQAVPCAAQGPAAARPAAPAAAASPWKELRYTEPPNGRVEGTKMLKSGDLNNQKLFDAYWASFVSQLTWAAQDPAKVRKGIKDVLRGGKDPARERLAKNIVLPICTKIAKGEIYSPQARVNAVLTIGELNQIEPLPGGPAQVSLPEARPILIELLDPKLPVNDVNDALRVEAMVGLMNHLDRGGITDEKQRKQVDSLLQSVLNAKEPPSGRQPDVHKWMQRLATEVRASLTGGEVVRGG